MRRTILLADDSPTIRRLVTQVFAGGEFDVVSVSNGEAAIKAFEETRPSVVLADIYMPGKNGYEVCAYIRNHPVRSATPVVLLVGAFDAFDEEIAKRAGATANIRKPVEPSALIELVNSVLLPEGSESSGTVENESSDGEDLLGLGAIFEKEEARPPAEAPASSATASVTASISDDDIDRIANRVMQKVSSQIIERIAWDVLPDLTEKIVREELRRTDGSGAATVKDKHEG